MRYANLILAAGMAVTSDPVAAGTAGDLEVFSDFPAFVDAVSDLGPLTQEDFEGSFARFLPQTEFASCVEPVTADSSDACFGPGDLVEGITLTSSKTYGMVVVGSRRYDTGSRAIAAWPFRVSSPDESLNFTNVTFDEPMLAVAADVYGFKLSGGEPTGDPVPVMIEAFDTQGGSIGSLTVNPPDYDEAVFVGLRSPVPIGRIEYGTRTPIAGEMIDNLFFAGGPGRLVATPDTVDFGPVRTGGSVATPVTLTNIGYQPVDIDNVAAPGAPFSVAGDTCTAATLGAGATCMFDAVFAPDHAGLFDGTASVAAGDAGADIALTGAGVRPRLAVRPLTLDFGPVVVDTTSPARAVTLRNPVDLPVEVTGVGMVGMPFQAAGGTCEPVPFLLSPGDECVLEYTFTPEGTGGHAVTLEIETSGSPATRAVRLIGEGVDATRATSNGE